MGGGGGHKKRQQASKNDANHETSVDEHGCPCLIGAVLNCKLRKSKKLRHRTPAIAFHHETGRRLDRFFLEHKALAFVPAPGPHFHARSAARFRPEAAPA